MFKHCQWDSHPVFCFSVHQTLQRSFTSLCPICYADAMTLMSEVAWPVTWPKVYILVMSNSRIFDFGLTEVFVWLKWSKGITQRQLFYKLYYLKHQLGYMEILHFYLMFPMQHVVRCNRMGKLPFNLCSQSLTKERWCHVNIVLWIQVFHAQSSFKCPSVHMFLCICACMHSSHDDWSSDHLGQKLYSASLNNIVGLAGWGKWGKLIYSLVIAGSITGFL